MVFVKHKKYNNYYMAIQKFTSTTYAEQIDNCKWFLSEFLSTCGSRVNRGQAPVTLTLYLYDTCTMAKPEPVALISTCLTFLGICEKYRKYLLNCLINAHYKV